MCSPVWFQLHHCDWLSMAHLQLGACENHLWRWNGEPPFCCLCATLKGLGCLSHLGCAGAKSNASDSISNRRGSITRASTATCRRTVMGTMEAKLLIHAAQTWSTNSLLVQHIPPPVTSLFQSSLQSSKVKLVGLFCHVSAKRHPRAWASSFDSEPGRSHCRGDRLYFVWLLIKSQTLAG